MKRSYAYVVIDTIHEVRRETPGTFKGYALKMAVVGTNCQYDQSHFAGLDGVTFTFAETLIQDGRVHDVYHLAVDGDAVYTCHIERYFMSIADSRATEEEIRNELTAAQTYRERI